MRRAFAALVVFLGLIFWGLLFLPIFLVYGGFGLLDSLATKERYTLDYYIYLESLEPFENVTVFIPTAKLGLEEITPENFETIKIDNRTYIKITRDKPFSERHRLWEENKTVTRYRMDISIELPKRRIENLSEYRIDDGNVRILLSYTNASYVSLQIMLYYLELDYVDVLGKRIYTNPGHFNYLWCKTAPVNVTNKERGRWVEVPVMCST